MQDSDFYAEIKQKIAMRKERLFHDTSVAKAFRHAVDTVCRQAPASGQQSIASFDPLDAHERAAWWWRIGSEVDVAPVRQRLSCMSAERVQQVYCSGSRSPTCCTISSCNSMELNKIGKQAMIFSWLSNWHHRLSTAQCFPVEDFNRMAWVFWY